jgi:DNA polymerase-3 subunit epsilon
MRSLLAQVYVELTGGRQIGLSLTDTRRDGRISAASVSRSPARTAREGTPPRRVRRRADTARRIRRGLTNPIWNRAA